MGHLSAAARVFLLSSLISAHRVTFRVDVAGGGSSNGVHIAGSFQSWDPAATPLLEAADGLYEATLNLSSGRHWFKFLNGNSWDHAEVVPGSCADTEGEHYNRLLELSNESILEVQFCFGGCNKVCAEVPRCANFSCPAGYEFKDNYLDLRGDAAQDCCKSSTPCSLFHCPRSFATELDALDQPSDIPTCCREVIPGHADVVVRSAGFLDGSEVSFHLDGQLLHDTKRRGLTVAILRDNLMLETLQTFDTFGSTEEVDALQAHLEALPMGKWILIGASDEASNKLSDGARAAIRACGATQIDSLGWRGSYALIGRKGGSALSEAVAASGAGISLAAAELERVPETLPLQRCEARVAEPPVSGFLSDGNLHLDAGCHYPIWQTESAGQCLQGAWIVLGGTSNMLLYFNALVKMLAPEEAVLKRGGEKGQWGNENVIDVFIQNGRIVHWNSFAGWDSAVACRQVNKDAFAKLADECWSLLAGNISASSSAFSPGNTTRVTMFMSFFWDMASMATDLITADAQWAHADLSFVFQVVAWYRICNVAQWSYCPRKELFDLSFDEALTLFDSEMSVVLDKLEKICVPGGRAGRLGCVVGTNTWSEQGVSPTSSYSLLNERVRIAMRPRSTATLRHVDFFALGAAMTHEVYNGHGSPVLNLWSWQVMLNGMCPDSLAPQGRSALFDGLSCSALDASFNKCPDYVETCGDWCELWYCMNSVPCVMNSMALNETMTSTVPSTTSTEPLAPTTAMPTSSFEQLAVTYFWSHGAKECPPAAVSLTQSECQAIAAAYGLPSVETGSVTSADESSGCFTHDDAIFYNFHSSGSSREGRALACKSIHAPGDCPKVAPSEPWTYVIAEVPSNQCAQGTQPLTLEECKVVENKSDGGLRNFRQIDQAGDPTGCFKFGSWSLYYNTHPTGAVREGRYPICRVPSLV